MWRKSAMSRIEFHQGQKQKLAKVFALFLVRAHGLNLFYAVYACILVRVCLPACACKLVL